MKKLIIIIALFTSGLLCETTYAQVRFRVNISSQPIWGPVGYDHVEYYYLPDIDAFVDVYKVDLKDFDKEELVLPGPYSVYWVNLMPFKNGKYIACNIASRDGGISSAIYNCETKEYKILTEIDHNFVPVYFPKTETLHYLNPVKRTFTKEVSYR